MKTNDEFQRDDLYDEHLKSDEFSFLNEIEEYDERFFHEDEYNRNCYVGLNKRETDELSDEEAAVIRSKPVGLLAKTASTIKAFAMCFAFVTMLMAVPSINGNGDLFSFFENTPTDENNAPAVSVEHDHIPGDWQLTFEPTCTTDGEEQLLCKECNEVLETRTVQKKGHTSGEWIHKSDATCLAQGLDEKHCTACGTLLESKTINRVEHREGYPRNRA